MGYTDFSKDRFSKYNFTKINFIKTGGRNMCDKFIGRKNELKSLETAYSKNSFQMCIVYGRRRIGKTTLINEFIRGKEHIAFTAIKGSAERNIELFGEVVVDYFMPGINGVRFTDIKDILNFITNNIGDKKLVLVIDELPYWAEIVDSLLSILLKYIDTEWQNKNLFIILCGSALSFMEKKVLSEKSHLFGRRDSQIKLEGFNYKDSALFVPDYSFEEKAICYGITGGVAKYLSMIDKTKTLDENIKHLFFHTDGYLYDETRNLLTQEFMDIALVNNIIEKIASGQNTINLISEKVKEKASTVLYSIDKLMEVGLIEKKNCITEEKNKKKTQYILKDHMFKFWYEFIPKATSVIEMGHGDIYYEKAVKPNLHSYMGSVFEEMCRYYTLEQGICGKFDNFITRVGSWWGNETLESKDGKKYQQSTDIDIVAVSDIDKTAVVGECKFKNEPIGKEIYDTLLRRRKLISGKYRISKYLLFSLSGYTSWFDELNDGNLRMFTLAELYE